MIYHMCRAEEWAAAQSTGVYRGSSQDLADGFIRAATVPDVEGEVFNLGGGEEISMRALATTILGLMGDPIVAEFGVLPQRPTEIWSMRADVTKANKVLGLPPARSLREGLEPTIAWYRRELEQSASLFSV